jgi:hypothetical protein
MAMSTLQNSLVNVAFRSPDEEPSAPVHLVRFLRGTDPVAINADSQIIPDVVKIPSNLISKSARNLCHCQLLNAASPRAIDQKYRSANAVIPLSVDVLQGSANIKASC